MTMITDSYSFALCFRMRQFIQHEHNGSCGRGFRWVSQDDVHLRSRIRSTVHGQMVQRSARVLQVRAKRIATHQSVSVARHKRRRKCTKWQYNFNNDNIYHCAKYYSVYRVHALLIILIIIVLKAARVCGTRPGSVVHCYVFTSKMKPLMEIYRLPFRNTPQNTIKLLYLYETLMNDQTL